MSVRNYLLELQAQICAALEREDGEGQFREDLWLHTEGGGGISRLMQDGRVFEKAGVNFSHIYGPRLPPTASTRRPELAGRSFQALGVSLVVHPLNPYVPASHANIRFFVAGGSEEQSAWWFGGGYDLTPYYGFVADCVHWHSAARKACEPFGKHIYPRFKQQCDEYFFISHRKEARGIGGLFFDNLTEWGFETCFAFSRSVGDSFLPAYFPIVSRRKNSPYGERERLFQLYRRGRYVEFNLVCDRGTLFGLQSNGRVESILMSLPPLAAWPAGGASEDNSADEKLLRDFLAPRDWLDAAQLNQAKPGSAKGLGPAAKSTQYGTALTDFSDPALGLHFEPGQ